MLTFDSEETIHVDHDWRMWVSVKHFTLVDSHASDAEVVRAIITHPEYQDRYDQPPGMDPGGHGLHGLFIAAALSLDHFSAIDFIRASTELTVWTTEETEADSPKVRAVLRQRVMPLIEAATSLLLLDAPDAALADAHANAIVCGVHGWHEFVAIDRQSRTVKVLVAGDD